MQHNDAVRLISKTFEARYSEDAFRQFIYEILPGTIARNNIYSGNYIPVAYRNYILSYKYLCKYVTPDGDELAVLAVNCIKAQTLEKARTAQRNFIANYMKERGKNACLVAFYSDDNERSTWRFSFVRIDETFNWETLKAKEVITPAKRYSYMVGVKESSHTAQQQLCSLLESGASPTLADLEQAFAIERISDEFFLAYKNKFLELVEFMEDLRKQDAGLNFNFINISNELFCKKLLGQIVFLYFLQKKGWLGVPENSDWGNGDRNFMTTLFNRAAENNENYFNDYLEPLFYEALAKERKNHFYAPLNCKIPFLNGGLFEPIGNYDWEGTVINIPNEIFCNGSSGILDVFNRYNFTVREDEPMEKEVAIDPEMLGKVFENLLEIKDRKSKGAFYTPREIVHYMCQESLIQYLITKFDDKISTDALTFFIKYGDLYSELEDSGVKSYKDKLPPEFEDLRQYASEIDDALADVKICDPAIGSGAFPVGMMHEIIRARQTLLNSGFINKTRYTTLYDYKRQIIQHSIYGVDIEQSAVDIAKLRLWLSLIVDEDAFDNIRPLPNLDYKIVCGNSLQMVDKHNLLTYQHSEQLDKLKQEYFDTTDKKHKISLSNQIKKAIYELTEKGTIFDFKVYFSEVFDRNNGFDIVIGNPPYGADLKPSEKNFCKTHYRTTISVPGKQKGSLNTYTLFIEQGFNLLKKNGTLIYIVPMSITSSDSVMALHNLLEQNCSIIKVSSYSVRPQPVFANAVVNTSIISFVKDDLANKHIYCTKMYRRTQNFNLQYLVNNLEFIDVAELKLPGRYPKISSKIESTILHKIMHNSGNTVQDIICKKGISIYYRAAGGRYFKVITPYTTHSSAEKELIFDSPYAQSIGAILSSNLFFWFYQIFSDNLNMKSAEILSFPIPKNKLTPSIRKALENIYYRYLDNIEKNAIEHKTTNYAHIQSFKEYKIGKSKHLIDQIDDLIGPLYGLTKEEIEFIKNYELEFRISDDRD